MAHVPIIDLTSSPEPEESPNKTASAALAQFQPSKERINKIVGRARHDQRAYGDAPPAGLHVAPSHSAQLKRVNNQPQHRSTHPYNRPEVYHQRTPSSQWSAPRVNGDSNGVVPGTWPSPVEQTSLAGLLREEAQRSFEYSRLESAGPVHQPQHLAEDHQHRRWNNGVSSKLERNAVNTKPRPTNGAITSHTPPPISSLNRDANAKADSDVNRINQTQPSALTSQPPRQASSVLPPSKRPSSTLQDGNLYTPNKRHHMSTGKSGTAVQYSAGRPEPPRVRKPWLVDVTDSTMDEHATFSDDTHGSDPPNQSVQGTIVAAAESPPVVPSNNPLPQPLIHAPSGKPRASNHGNPYSAEEDDLLRRLKEVDQLSWDDIVPQFAGRSRGSLQVRYSTKLAFKPTTAANRLSERIVESRETTSVPRSQSPDPTSRPKRKRKQPIAAVDGLVSWSEVIAAHKSKAVVQEQEPQESPPRDLDPSLAQDRALPSSMARLLRQRMFGKGGGRAWQSRASSMSDELREHVCSDYALSHYHQGTSGDVLSLSWSPDGTRFAAGSAAISDNNSMQYNMSRNLLLGDVEREELRELVEHHEPRPIVSDSKNINAVHAMRESQDSRLFVTVTATSFSRDGSCLFTAGKDKKLRVYSTDRPLHESKCRYEVSHAAAVDLLSVSNDGLIATGCHLQNESINVYSCGESYFESKARLSPSQSEALAPSLPLYPSSLKWGISHQHRNLLLAGFCNDSIVHDDKQSAGATCIWDLHNQQQIPLKAATCNVFDVTWNPLPTSASAAFAVASNPSGIGVDKGTRSVVQLFAPNQDMLRRVLLWQCPALDINDVIFCPHDANLIACGATDGKVYVWDQRFADRAQKPLHVLEHGESLTVLPDIDRELIDTGVRFLSWGASKTRLFSGSSDGVVKVWNPYRSPHNTEVEEFMAPRHQRSAIMAGAFSSDHRNLLVGTEVGQINLFSIGRRAHIQPAKRWKMHASPSPSVTEPDPRLETKALLASGKIELRPCGALPIRQAVQGPNYDGPFASTTTEIQQAQDSYQQALDAQNQLHLSTHTDEADLEKAAVRVRDALAALTDQEDRLEFQRSCRPKAEAFQRSLRAAETYRVLLQKSAPAHHDQRPCRLDCGYFEATGENAADSGASELRIPGFLGLVHRSKVIEDTNEDGIGEDPGTSPVCPSCHPFSRSSKRRVRCRECRLKLAGLTATCAKCSAPARPSTGEKRENLCANCGFACFRCGLPAIVSSEMDTVHCNGCNLTWEAGVLGYELLGRRGMTDDVKAQGLSSNMNGTEDPCDNIGLGNTEIEHYASQWDVQMPLEQEGMGSIHFAAR